MLFYAGGYQQLFIQGLNNRKDYADFEQQMVLSSDLGKVHGVVSH